MVPNTYDRILTLSTCTGNGHATRWVVQAVLRGEAPSDTAEQEPAAPETPETVPETPETPDTPEAQAPQETEEGSSLLDVAVGSVTGGDAGEDDAPAEDTSPAQ